MGKRNPCGQSPGGLNVELGGLAWSPSEARLYLISMYFDAPKSSLTPLLPLALSQVRPAKLQDWGPQTAELPVLPLD